MQNALELFDEFMEFREKFISDSIKTAHYTEKRDDVEVRPVNIIKTEHELRSLNVKLAEWALYVKRLIALDPTRFHEAQKMFNPAPVVLHNKSHCLIRRFEAVSSRKRSREGMIKDLKARLFTLTRQQDPIYAKEIIKTRAEIAFYQNDTDEESYRIRSEGYPETIIMVSDHGVKGQAKKLRVSMSGVFIYNPDGKTVIELPKRLAPNKRSHSLTFLGCKPLPPSRNIRGTVYRISDIERAKEEAALEKAALALDPNFYQAQQQVGYG